MGRTPLHVASAMGRSDCIKLLLNYGASIHGKDAKGETPISIARRLQGGHGEQRMILFYWMAKLGVKQPVDLVPNEAFQKVKHGIGSKKKSKT